MAKAADDDESLKRLGGGRWQTRDERFTIEPQSGTWVVVDGEQTDDLGLPLIRGPFGSLGAAKEAIATARTSAVPVKPLPRPAKTTAKEAEPDDTPVRKGSRGASTGSAGAAKAAKPASASPKPTKPGPPPEPRWIADLSPAARRQARVAISSLTAAGATDPEGIARRDIAGGVPAIATYALTRRLKELGSDATPDAIVDLLSDGRDDTLDVRWRVVDGEGRPIVLTRTAKPRSPRA